MTFSSHSDLEAFAACLVRGAALELYLTPKPGLVDLLDSGSHSDLTVEKMEGSLLILQDYLGDLCQSLSGEEPLATQKKIGLQAEKRMFREIGTNAHKGYIFLSGLLLAARRSCAGEGDDALQCEVARRAAEFFALEPPGQSHGRAVSTRYGSEGIIAEARAGLPAVFNHGMSVFREVREETGSFTLASFATLARLMQVVEDTTTLYRCGPAGLARIRSDGERLEKIVRSKGGYMSHLRKLNAAYRGENLTMGGVADLLALTIGLVEAADAARAEAPATKGREPMPAFTTAEAGGPPA